MNDEIMVTNEWHADEVNEEWSTLTITIPIPNKVLNKLKEYGYDFTTNLTNNLKEVYWQLCAAERPNNLEDDLREQEADN